MRVILLSAGQGRRLLPLTEDVPKCALLVAGRSILEWQLNEIGQCAVDEVVVVTGFEARVVDNIVAAANFPGRIRTFHNPFYASSDNLGTVWIAREEMHEPFVIINGDTLFEAAILQNLLDGDSRNSSKPITLVTDQKAEYDDDDMKVISDNGQLRRVGKKLSATAVDAESIGMMSFRGDGPALFRDKVAELMAGENGLSLWYLSAIDALAQEGHVAVCPITGKRWCEVDVRADLDNADAILGQWHESAIEATL